MQTTAVVLRRPLDVGLETLELDRPLDGDIVVDTYFTGISTGTERLLWDGRMPSFPGMGYPLVPGYEAIGEVVEAGPGSGLSVGETVFVPGAKCYGDVRALFGASASRVVTQSSRVIKVSHDLGEQGLAIALAATAYHAIATGEDPQLIIGHGTLGRLLARLTVLLGGEPPIVWETNEVRRTGGDGYSVIHPDDDPRRDYSTIYDASGDASLLDQLISRMSKGGEVVLAGFYHDRISFAFAPAFMREARFRIASEWQPHDLEAVTELIAASRLSLGGLVTHVKPCEDVADAYRTAFEDSTCLKMALDWRSVQ
ncbi:MAG: chlorophyll synthesis pathway protein BchC [Pseudomonadota bacterium]